VFLFVQPIAARANRPQVFHQLPHRGDRVRRHRLQRLGRQPRIDRGFGFERQQCFAEAGAVSGHDAADPRSHEPDRMRRLQPLEIQHLPGVEDRQMHGLAGDVAQPLEMPLRFLADIERGRDHVAEHKTFDAELIFAADLRDKPRFFESCQQAKGGWTRNAGTRSEIGERQSRLAKRERAEQIERLRGGVDRVASRRNCPRGPFHWVKWYIAE
jgi:hypothetical protein